MAKQLNTSLPLLALTCDGVTQQRPLQPPKVNEYALLMQDGVEFPPIDVVFDGKDYWVYDGFHRIHATKRLGRNQITANVVKGTKRDAEWLSFAANKDRGLTRHPETITFILQRKVFPDAVWGKMSIQEIARHVGCSVRHASRVKKDYDAEQQRAADVAKGIAPQSTESLPKLHDGTGAEIPDNRRNNWLAKVVIEKRIEEIVGILNSVENSIDAGELTYTLLPQGKLKSGLLKAKDALLNARPYALCPYCKSKGCEKCHNFGFINHRTFKLLP